MTATHHHPRSAHHPHTAGPGRVLLLAVLLVLALMTTLSDTTPAGGGVPELPSTLALAPGSLPEGITRGEGSTLYAGSRLDGTVYVLHARTGERDVLVPGASGRVAVGMHHDRRSRTLWVVGGATGTLRAYDTRDGAPLGEWETGTGRFLNDVTVTERAAYVTDSLNAELVVVPLDRRGRPQGGTRTLPLHGDWEQTPGFNANGIRPLTNGDLVVVQSSTAELHRVDPRTGTTDRIELAGPALTGGDGLVLTGRTLHVVNGYENQVAVVELARGHRSGRAVGTITDPELDRPTTGTTSRGRLWVVNGRFGVPPTPTTEYWITSLPLSPTTTFPTP